MIVPDDIPIRVSSRSTQIAGPISGKIREKVDAKVNASTAHESAKTGLYGRGYRAADASVSW